MFDFTPDGYQFHGGGSAGHEQPSGPSTDCYIARAQFFVLGVFDVATTVLGVKALSLAVRGGVRLGLGAAKSLSASLIRSSTAVGASGLPIGPISRQVATAAAGDIAVGGSYSYLAKATAVRGAEQIGISGGVLGDRPAAVLRGAEWVFPSIKAWRRMRAVCN